jgi:hypothetical protein
LGNSIGVLLGIAGRSDHQVVSEGL